MTFVADREIPLRIEISWQDSSGTLAFLLGETLGRYLLDCVEVERVFRVIVVAPSGLPTVPVPMSAAWPGKSAHSWQPRSTAVQVSREEFLARVVERPDSVPDDR